MNTKHRNALNTQNMLTECYCNQFGTMYQNSKALFAFNLR